MKKILSLFFIAFITVNNVYPIEIDGINYNFDEVSLTASVVSKNPKYSGNIILPSSVAHEGKTYSVTKIENSAFDGCYELDSIILPQQLEYIGGSAFWSSGLKYIRIPGSVREIGGMAFVNCSELDSIDIENGVSTIVSYAFANCTKLRNITIPASVTTLEHNTFEGCSSLINVDILGSIQLLEENLFKGCIKLKYFDVPESVQSICANAFKDCTSLDSITLHEGIVNIMDAFNGCDSLRNITLPSTLLHMYGSFWSCSRIEYIRSYATNPPVCHTNCFTNINKSIPVYVPSGSGNLYRNADHWKYFFNVIEENTPTDITSIKAKNEHCKLLHNGQIYILRGDKTYTLTGHEIK